MRIVDGTVYFHIAVVNEAERNLAGAPAHRLELTFTEGVGLTPQNRYHVYIGTESHLVEQWDFFRSPEDAEPSFQLPWEGWEVHGEILLSGDRGSMNGRPVALTDIVVMDAPPLGIFTHDEAIELDD